MNEINFQEALKLAVKEPGQLMKAYSAFHNYSIGNQLLAMSQCISRRIEIGPLASFNGWKEKGRNIRRGEKAIALFMPVSVKRDVSEEIDAGGSEEKKDVAFTRFALKRNWFVLAQTEGEEAKFDFPTSQWNREAALAKLNVKLVPFDEINGNKQGFATGEREIAINPLAQHYFKTLFHELAHVVLGHLDSSEHEENQIPRKLQEVEAESVALLCLGCLGLPGAEYCRGYIQAWLSGEEIPEKSAQRIVVAANGILKAGDQ